MAKTQPSQTLIAFVLFVTIFQFILAEGRHIRLVMKSNSFSKPSLGEDLAGQSDELHRISTDSGHSHGDGHRILLINGFQMPNVGDHASSDLNKILPNQMGANLVGQPDELHPSGTNPGRSPGVGHVLVEKAHDTLRVNGCQIPKTRVHAKNGMNRILKIVGQQNVLHPSDTNPGQSPGVGHSAFERVSINGHRSPKVVNHADSKQNKILTSEEREDLVGQPDERHPSGTNPGRSPGVGHAVENKNKDTKISEQSRV